MTYHYMHISFFWAPIYSSIHSRSQAYLLGISVAFIEAWKNPWNELKPHQEQQITTQPPKFGQSLQIRVQISPNTWGILSNPSIQNMLIVTLIFTFTKPSHQQTSTLALPEIQWIQGTKPFLQFPSADGLQTRQTFRKGTVDWRTRGAWDVCCKKMWTLRLWGYFFCMLEGGFSLKWFESPMLMWERWRFGNIFRCKWSDCYSTTIYPKIFLRFFSTIPTEAKPRSPSIAFNDRSKVEDLRMTRNNQMDIKNKIPEKKWPLR